MTVHQWGECKDFSAFNQSQFKVAVYDLYNRIECITYLCATVRFCYREDNVRQHYLSFQILIFTHKIDQDLPPSVSPEAKLKD